MGDAGWNMHYGASPKLFDLAGELRAKMTTAELILWNIIKVNESQVLTTFLIKQDLMIISLESWKKLVESQSLWLNSMPSVLIIKP